MLLKVLESYQNNDNDNLICIRVTIHTMHELAVTFKTVLITPEINALTISSLLYFCTVQSKNSRNLPH